MELKDLVGEHVLDGVDMFDGRIKRQWSDEFEDAQMMRFRLDGVIYLAIEDPSDGYRSSMRDIQVSHDQMKNVFAPQRVLARHRTKGDYGDEDDVLELIDLQNGKVVLEVGTRNVDNYYPSFTNNFSPENFAATLARTLT